MRTDRGQAVPWMLLLLATAMAVIVIAGRLSRVVDDAARARTAADAAALASAAEGERSARSFAMANGGELVSFERRGSRVEVVVRVGEVSARAEASATASWRRFDGPD